MSQGQTALVTGGAGFIGSHMVDRLLDEGFRVIIVDDLTSGKLKNVNQRAVFHHMSITQPSLPDLFHREKPDLVFHMAAQSSVARSVREPILDSEVNVLGTLRLLEAARRAGVHKIIYSCTGGALYGDPDALPCPDNALVIPISPYGMSKYIAEQYLEFYRRQYMVNFTSLRYGNVYGPRQDAAGEAGVIAIFIDAMLRGRPPRIFGDGNQERDFVSVYDVIEANIAAITRGDGKAMNIATGQLTSVNRIFQLLKEITGFRWSAAQAPARTGDVYRISLDCALAAAELGWTPRITLADGLARTVESLRASNALAEAR